MSQFSQAAPLGHLVHEVARLFRRRFEEEAKVHGITMPQWKALAEIARNPGITQVALAALTDTDPMTMSGILDRLEKRELIERSPDPRDSRAKVVHIASAGVHIVDSARKVGLAILPAPPRDRRGGGAAHPRCARAHPQQSRRHVCRRKGKCLK